MENSNDTIGNRTRDLNQLRYGVPHNIGVSVRILFCNRRVRMQLCQERPVEISFICPLGISVKVSSINLRQSSEDIFKYFLECTGEIIFWKVELSLRNLEHLTI
jgi:hypothetical protein